MATIKAGTRPVSTAIVLAVALALILLLSLLGSIFPTSPATATPDEVRWSRVNIPAEGEIGNWVLASGSSVQHLTMANDSTLYCYASPSGTDHTLFKSTDTGCSWSFTGEVREAIVDIATAPDDANIIYYATESSIYKSADAGNSFAPLPSSPGGAGADNITIACIDVARLGSNNIVAVGTVDSDNSQYGGVYTLDENETLPSWLDTNIDNYDACAVTFSPNFDTDRQVVAVVTDEQDILVTARIGDGSWGQIIGDATIGSLVPISASIAFPDDYDATTEDYILFVAIDTGSGNGDVYKVNGKWAPDSSIATDLNIGAVYSLSDVDVTGLAVNGNTAAASLLAGAASSNQVYISTDSGENWIRSTKQPTGQPKTCLLMAPDFVSSGTAYAATIGTESAFSYTTDGGVTWNQSGLIDTKISGNGIIDLSLSLNYSQDGTLFMLTFDTAHTEHSLWRSLNGGAKWERVFSSTLGNIDSINLVELSPRYGSGSQVVFLAGTDNGTPAIWKSADNGQTFICRSAPSSVDIWTVVNDNTLFLGSYNGTNGLVYRTTDSGSSYSTGVVAGSQSLKSIVRSPNYEQDETILIGNTGGWVYCSRDNGTSFKPLPLDATSPPLTGSITVAFDSEFAGNNTVYAASNSADKGIYRFIINKSTEWESVDGTLPAGSTLSQIAVSADGALYATNSQSVDTTEREGGMERSLNPAYPLSPTFETVTRGLDDGVTLSGLWLQGNQLWSIDTKNNRLVTYTDSLNLPVTLTSPSNKASGTDTRNVILEWGTLRGTTEYKWQLDYDTDFSTVPTDFEGDTRASSVRLPALDTDTTYYWRVRATEPVLSRWSAKRSFTTALGHTAVAPELLSPKAGVTETSLKPLFQWSAIAGAESYELVVSIDFSFANPAIAKIGNYALPATAWQSNINLDYNTTYYWKVRAVGSSSYSAWSAVGAFTTELPPALGHTDVAPELLSPEAGATEISLKPLFQWSAIAGAESYEVIVSTGFSFANPTIVKIGNYALPATAWQSNINLDYNTTYYWKVRAVGSSSYSAWSAVGAFTTLSPPAQPSPEPESSTSLSPQPSSPPSSSSPVQSTIPDWVIYLTAALLLTTVLLLITLLLVVTIRRSKSG